MNLNKIVITGHSAGFGATMYNSLSNDGKTVMGFDLASGYDIADESATDKICQITADYDVLINNVYHPTGQYSLAKKWIDASTKPRMLINLSSELRTYQDYIDNQHEDTKAYIANKQKLYDLGRDTNYKTTLCRVVNLSLGWLDTKYNNEYFPCQPEVVQLGKRVKVECGLITADSVMPAVNFILENSDSVKFISNLSVSSFIVG